MTQRLLSLATPPLVLRDYQRLAIDMLYQWLGANEGSPCIVLPTGSGKSVVIAALCKEALTEWPGTRILALTHVRELIEQNAAKMRAVWPAAPFGIYSAGLGRKEWSEPITFAGIQSARSLPSLFGFVSLIIVDEAHLISHEDTGGYRTLIAALREANPDVRVIGLTATPYRLGHGLITEKPAIFDALIEPVSVQYLVEKGHLCKLRSRVTTTVISTDGVIKRGGEFVENALQKAVDVEATNTACAAELVAIGSAEQRKHWLIFATGVAHAEHMRDALRALGVTAETVTGATPSAERDAILDRFRRGEIRAVTNANVLTTGFDFPGIDLIAMCRPTMSVVLYAQMAGRGMRPKPQGGDCLVLDFAGNVERHGPITNLRPPEKGGSGDGPAPTKICGDCGEINHLSARACDHCGKAFPAPEKPRLELRDDDIMGEKPRTLVVGSWRWRVHVSNSTGKMMLACSYHGRGLSDPIITEYHVIAHDGYAGEKARRTVSSLAAKGGVPTELLRESFGQVSTAHDDRHLYRTLAAFAEALDLAACPAEIVYAKEGKFFRVLGRKWSPF